MSEQDIDNYHEGPWDAPDDRSDGGDHGGDSVVDIHNDVTDYRAPPSNEEAEQAILGAILYDNEATTRISTYLRADHFYNPVHGRIYKAALDLIEKGQVANPVTLRTWFDRDDGLADVGGGAYLADLADAGVSTLLAENYARAVYDLALRRDLIRIGEEVVDMAQDSPLNITAQEQIERAEGNLFTLAETGEGDRGFVSFKSALTKSIESTEDAYKREGQMSGYTSGFHELDEMIGGLHKSDLIIVAGRPGMGKTTLAVNIAFNTATWFMQEQREKPKSERKGCAIFSLEMSAEQLAGRLLSSESDIDSHKLREGRIDADDFARLVDASQRIESTPLYIDDTPAISISALRTRARRLKRQQGLGLVVVDYLQLMQGSSNKAKENRVQELSEITMGLKAVAKELEIPVIALSQLSRGVESREDKRPQLSDLRESGSIEQDADMVFFVYREEYYLKMKEPQADSVEYPAWQEKMDAAHGRAEVIIGKQRHGPTGKVDLFFDGAKTKFRNLTRVNADDYDIH